MRQHLSNLCLTALFFIAVPAFADTEISDGPNVPQLAVFDQAMIDFMNDFNVPAGQLAVTWQGRLVYSRAFSNGAESAVDVNTLFRVASTSKPLTATLIYRAQQDGLLSLDDPISDYLDLTPLPGRSADARLAGITVRQLLEHLGGFGAPADYGYDPVFYDHVVAQNVGEGLPVLKSHVMQYMNGLQLRYQPGTTYAYSNYGFMLAGMVLEQATGMAYHAYADSVFNPIGIRRARLARSDESKRYENEVHYFSGNSNTTVMNGGGQVVPLEYGALNSENMQAFGGWTINATELARWLSNLDKPHAAGAILNASSQAEMFALPGNFSGPYTPGEYFYGSGWAVRDYGNGNRNTWHAGSLPSTTSYVARIQDGFNFAVVFNRRNETGQGQSLQGAFDSYIFPARNQVAQWPQHDLFDSLLMPTPEDIDARYGGSWFDASHNGEGFAIQVINSTTAVVYWFTYNRDGTQQWYFGVARLEGTRMIVDQLLTTEGGRFGPGFDPDDVQATVVGSLVINFYEHGGAKADYLLSADSGYLELARLSEPFANANPNNAGDWRNGLWYDLTHDGEGFVVEVLPDGRVVVYWFTYDRNGNPAWMVGSLSGDLDDGVVFSMLRPVGGRFGAGFDPGSVNVLSNGTAEMRISCDGDSEVIYSGSGSNFPAVELDLSRLATYVAPPCG